MISKKIFPMSILMLFFVLLTNSTNANTPPRLQVVAGYIENVTYASSNCTNCVSVSMKVEYTHNGQTFYQTSSSAIMNANDTQFFTVSIPKTAVVVKKEFVFTMDNGTVTHDYAANNSATYTSSGWNWCSCFVDPMTNLLMVDSTSGTNRFRLSPQGTIGFD